MPTRQTLPTGQDRPRRAPPSRAARARGGNKTVARGRRRTLCAAPAPPLPPGYGNVGVADCRDADHRHHHNPPGELQKVGLVQHCRPPPPRGTGAPGMTAGRAGRAPGSAMGSAAPLQVENHEKRQDGKRGPGGEQVQPPGELIGVSCVAGKPGRRRPPSWGRMAAKVPAGAWGDSRLRAIGRPRPWPAACAMGGQVHCRAPLRRRLPLSQARLGRPSAMQAPRPPAHITLCGRAAGTWGDPAKTPGR